MHRKSSTVVFDFEDALDISSEDTSDDDLEISDVKQYIISHSQEIASKFEASDEVWRQSTMLLDLGIPKEKITVDCLKLAGDLKILEQLTFRYKIEDLLEMRKASLNYNDSDYDELRWMTPVIEILEKKTVPIEELMDFHQDIDSCLWVLGQIKKGKAWEDIRSVWPNTIKQLESEVSQQDIQVSEQATLDSIIATFPRP